jgi:glycosyltransferase involved in cell wall biosynthesis
VLPAFNEALNLPATVADALAALQQFEVESEILIVDDGSSDGTVAVCRELAARHDCVHVIRHGRNRGYGAALRSGLDAARCPLVFFTDADGQFRFDQLPEFVANIDKIDMVIGYRARRHDAWHRKLNSLVGNWIVRSLLGVRVRDINCAYKLLRRESVACLALHSNGALINTELLALAGRAGWKVKELPVKHLPRRCGRSTGANPMVIFRTVLEYFQLRRRLIDIGRDISPKCPTYSLAPTKVGRLVDPSLP